MQNPGIKHLFVKPGHHNEIQYPTVNETYLRVLLSRYDVKGF